MFTERKLAPLTPRQCRTMLHTLAEAHDDPDLAQALATPAGLARVRAIHPITGGSPRAMALIFPTLTAPPPALKLPLDQGTVKLF